ncbi:hypothetical protein FKP32DRAFT_1686996 [Trametes sanguinea]|nr:hypothetical protein FKP32DRAFT_1686996 [Trametes sanguinea]
MSSVTVRLQIRHRTVPALGSLAEITACAAEIQHATPFKSIALQITADICCWTKTSAPTYAHSSTRSDATGLRSNAYKTLRPTVQGQWTHRFVAIVRCCPWCNGCKVCILREGEAGQAVVVYEVVRNGAGHIARYADSGREGFLIGARLHVTGSVGEDGDDGGSRKASGGEAEIKGRAAGEEEEGEDGRREERAALSEEAEEGLAAATDSQALHSSGGGFFPYLAQLLPYRCHRRGCSSPSILIARLPVNRSLDTSTSHLPRSALALKRYQDSHVDGDIVAFAARGVTHRTLLTLTARSVLAAQDAMFTVSTSVLRPCV